MPIITFASSKGGVGRTTAAIVLAITLARHHKVTLIDADPAARLISWARMAPLPGRLTVMASRGEKHILKEIKAAEANSDFAIIDLEGARTRLNGRVIGESDLVIIPTGDEHQDGQEVINTLSQVRIEVRFTHREIPTRILFVRTEESKAKSSLAKSLNEQIRANCSCFTTELRRLPAFSWLHNMGGTLFDLDPQEVERLAQAIVCTELFAEEVIEALPKFNMGKVSSGQTVDMKFNQSFYARLQALCRQEERSDAEMLEVLLASYRSKT